MNEQQPEALRLADALEFAATTGDMGRKPDPKCNKRKAAAELRRLQYEVDAIPAIKEERDTLQAEITALRQAIEQQPADEKQSDDELMAWLTQAHCFVSSKDFTEAEARLYGWSALYTRSQPAAWEPLTDEQIWEAVCHCAADNRFEVARAIEAKLREKNTPKKDTP